VEWPQHPRQQRCHPRQVMGCKRRHRQDIFRVLVRDVVVLVVVAVWVKNADDYDRAVLSCAVQSCSCSYHLVWSCCDVPQRATIVL
jgi:hypothetical protein